jgi:hypothetical protein
MIKRNKLLGASIALLLTTFNTAAQESRFEELQRSIGMFSGILEEVLKLDQRPGLFGLSLAGIENNYLLGQGVVFEIRTPLANRRNRINLASLNSAMQSLQSRPNPFEAVGMEPFTTDTDLPSPSILALDEANGYYREMMERIVNVDYSLSINTAIMQASDSLLSLRSLDSIEENDYEEIRNEIGALGVSVQSNLDQLQEIEQEIRIANTNVKAVDKNSPEQGLGNALALRLDAVSATIELLREQVLEKARELKERSEAAGREYVQRWERDKIDFESNLYAAMCNYGSILRELPENENISIILIGLGEESEESTHRVNKVHIISKTSVLQCQSGEIDRLTLQQSSAQYSY